MKELDFLKTITDTLSDSHHLGDDCAYLEDLGIFITQDSLVEDVHFSLKTTNPYLLGRKSVAVNLSDLAASLSEPKYILISLSLPPNTDTKFVEDFYKGVNEICNEYSVTVAGGDLTGSDKIFISIVAIGKKISQHISSRAYAKPGDIVVTTGLFGSSACGLFCIQNNIEASTRIIDAHINPCPKVKEGIKIQSLTDRNIAVMDTSDGFADAVFKISKASSCKIEINFDSIPFDSEIKKIADKQNKDYMDWILWGGEDYEIIACLPEHIANKLDSNIFKKIGKVSDSSQNPEVTITMNSGKITITEDTFNKKSFNHFDFERE